MNTKLRFIKSAIATSHHCHVDMPWARGKRRAAFIAKRNSQEPLKKSA